MRKNCNNNASYDTTQPCQLRLLPVSPPPPLPVFETGLGNPLLISELMQPVFKLVVMKNIEDDRALEDEPTEPVLNVMKLYAPAGTSMKSQLTMQMRASRDCMVAVTSRNVNVALLAHVEATSRSALPGTGSCKCVSTC